PGRECPSREPRLGEMGRLVRAPAGAARAARPSRIMDAAGAAQLRSLLLMWVIMFAPGLELREPRSSRPARARIPPLPRGTSFPGGGFLRAGAPGPSTVLGPPALPHRTVRAGLGPRPGL